MAVVRHESLALKFLVATFVIVAFGFFLSFIFPMLGSEELQTLVERSGVWGPMALGLYVILAHVIAPLTGIPAFIAGVAAFGIFKALIYIYLASMASAVINFFLSRFLGRTLIARLAGKRALATIDDFAMTLHPRTFLLVRVAGIAIFEEISYAAGLTAMSFRRYAWTTAVGTLVPFAAIGFFFRDTDFTSFFNVIFLMLSLIAISAILGLALSHSARVQRGRAARKTHSDNPR